MQRYRRAGFRRRVLASGLTVATLASLFSGAEAAAEHRCGHAGTTCIERSFTAVKVQRGVALFRLRNVAPSTIRRASIRMRHYRRRLALRQVRRGARRGVLRVSIPRRALTPRRSGRGGRRKPKLVLRLSRGPSLAQRPTRPVGSAPLSDGEAAARVRSSRFEPRPQNRAANRRVPSAVELALFRIASRGTLSGLQYDKVTGRFRGTTDEIIQWAAWKWGFDPDVFRAAAAVESWWVQRFVGDAGTSFGLMQLKVTDYVGTYPLSTLSTAFNVDYYGALMRYYYDGKASWLNGSCCLGATTYRAGDLVGSLATHYSGRWHDSAGRRYAARVADQLERRVWEEPRF